MQQSFSLPRIKPIPENAGSEDPIEKQRSFKFKKLKLDGVNSLGGGIPPLRHNRTERSQSVAIGLSNDERRTLKTQRTNLNLAEKRMRQGNYSQHDEVGNDLTRLKRDCSEYSTSIHHLQQEIEKLQRLIDDTKSENALYTNNSEALNAEMQKRRQRSTAIKAKVEDVLYERSRLLNMIRDRKSSNIVYQGRVEDHRYELTKIRKRLSMITTSELEIRDRENEADGKYQAALSEFQVSTRENQRLTEEREQKMQRLVDNEANREDRKHKLINISMSVVEEEKERVFRDNYNTFLTNRVLNRFLEDKLNRLLESSERIRYLNRKINQNYGPFTPEEYAHKFFQQEPEREKIVAESKRLEGNITDLEEKQRRLKASSAELQIEYLALGEQLDQRLLKLSQQEAPDPELNEQAEQAESKLKVISEWSLKNLQLVESLIVSKKERTQKMTSMPLLERLTRIMDLVKQWSTRSN